MNLAKRENKILVMIVIGFLVLTLGGVSFVWYKNVVEKKDIEDDKQERDLPNDQEVDDDASDDNDSSETDNGSNGNNDSNDDPNGVVGTNGIGGESYKDSNSSEDDGSYVSDYYGFQIDYPSSVLSIETYDKPPKGDTPLTIVKFNYIDNKLSKPLITLSVTKSDMTVMEWFEAKDFCPASTVDMCTEPVDLGSDMIQFEAINRHYGSIDTLFKVDGNLFNFSMGSRRPDSDFSEEEREVYQSILSSINFK